MVLIVPSTVTLEVERKFCGFAVSRLNASAGTPAFRSLQYLGRKTFKDTYFDLDNQLSARGIWVRVRQQHDGPAVWQAKCSKGGSYINSIFEELADVQAIEQCITSITAKHESAAKHFGLDQVAELTTERKSWLADNAFTIVLDSMDFGHEVGEVELEKTVALPTQCPGDVEQWKSHITKQMDEQIEHFMKRYSWAFKPGTPKGKLTAYYEKQAPR